MEIKLQKSFMYRIKEGDTLTKLCKNFNTSVENIIRNNKNIELYAGEYVKIFVNDYITHIVKPAETIEGISIKYNTTVEKIIKDNNLKNNKLYIGQNLKIYQ